jgi:hypothetical protein
LSVKGGVVTGWVVIGRVASISKNHTLGSSMLCKYYYFPCEKLDKYGSRQNVALCFKYLYYIKIIIERTK